MKVFSLILFFAGFLLGLLLIKKKHTESVAMRILNILTGKGIPLNIALLAVAQAKHETAMAGVPFTSPLYLRANNAFGYGNVKNNPYQIGAAGKHPEDSGVYAKYADVENSALDFAGYLLRRKNLWGMINDADSYATFLKNQKYYTAPVTQYTAGLNHFFTNTIS